MLTKNADRILRTVCLSFFGGKVADIDPGYLQDPILAYDGSIYSTLHDSLTSISDRNMENLLTSTMVGGGVAQAKESIKVGSSNADLSRDSIDLVNRIISNPFNASISESIKTTIPCSRTFLIGITNTSDTNQTIAEIGYYIAIYYQKYIFD